MVGFGTSDGLLEVAVMVTVCVLSLAGPGLMPERKAVWPPAFSRTVMLVAALTVGGWLTKAMVSRNGALEEATPSLTVMVIVAAPNVFGSGVMVAVRLLL